MNNSIISVFERFLKDSCQDHQNMSRCSLAAISQFVLFSTEGFTESLVCSITDPVTI